MSIFAMTMKPKAWIIDPIEQMQLIKKTTLDGSVHGGLSSIVKTNHSFILCNMNI